MVLASIDSLLGTLWFVLLVGSSSFVAGVWLSDTVKRMLGK